MQNSDYDVVIVGAGVSGCATARELSRLEARVLVIEREEDVCCGTSKANSAIVHAGYDARTGSLMAKLNVEGSRLMPALCESLGVDFMRIGSLVVCTSEEMLPGLEELRQRGANNGVEGLEVVDRPRLLELEPAVSHAALGALWAPTAGIVNPFQLNVAFAEDASVNGVDFRFNSRVSGLSRDDDGCWHVSCSTGNVTCRVVVNAAGVHADELHNLVSTDKLVITPRRGQYYVLDTTAGAHVRHTVFSQPTVLGKGVLITPTTAGNLLVGPNAEDITDKEGTDTTAEGLAEVAEKSSVAVRDVPLREVITSFSGLRAHQPGHDFVIGEVEGAPGFVDCAAIESPGLSACPAIGRMVAGIVRDILALAPKPVVTPWRSEFVSLDRATTEEWAALVEKNPAYGRVICRCRKVSEAQIVDAIHAPLGARSLDAVKRRTEACMGRCQAGFCTPKIMEILAREVEGMDMSDVTKAGPGSGIVVGTNKDGLAGDGR